RLAGGGLGVDVAGQPVGVECGLVGLHRGFGDLEVGERGVGLAVVVGVRDLAFGEAGPEGVHGGGGQAEGGADGRGGGDREQRDAVGGAAGVGLGGALAVDHDAQRQDPVGGDEDVLGHRADAAGAAQAGGVPVVDDLQVR